MNGNGVSRAHGPGLNGAGDFYYEAVEGAQSPGGLLLSPAAFINPAQYASVLEGRFKQLQGELPGWGGTGREQRSKARVGHGPCSADDVPGEELQEPTKNLVLTEWGKAWTPWKKGQ